MKVVIFGVSGRMGKELLQAASRLRGQGQDIEVLAGMVAEGDPALGHTVSDVRFPLAQSWQESFDEADMLIDFSAPEGAMAALAVASTRGIPLVECTTGLSEAEEKQVALAATKTPIVRARNTSIGVSVLAQLVRRATALLGPDYEVELVELHHRHKRDAPSGTAYHLLEEVAAARGESLSDSITLGRRGVGPERRKAEIGAQAVRGGDVAGEHTVYFFGEGERLELTHRATSRRIFADGAFRAARWLAQGRKPGLYSMLDVLEQA
ncbi:MAG: 4-hydroxy-tetrahydrodipicolinate reductase [Bdellovibrionales bacterium]|nr:4-hydroxy-tetrahydrodipicolinate reductase [Bdellovibrionales bacterium]